MTCKWPLFYKLALSALVAFATTGCSLTWLFPGPVGQKAILQNAPSSFSAVSNLAVAVTGDRLVSYRYKLGASSSTDCTSSAGYSSQWYPLGTPITDSTAAYPDQFVTLCVVALNTNGAAQSFSNPSIATWYVDVTSTTLSIVEAEQSAQEVDSSLKNFTVSSSIAKPYPINITFNITGDAMPAIDHSLPAMASVTLPANATSVTIPFHVYANSLSTASRSLTLTLASTDSPTAMFNALTQTSRFIIYDTDGGVRPTVTAFGVSPNTDVTCAILSNGVLKCWGNNSDGQLGDGTKIQRTTPTVVDGGTTYSQVSVGPTTVCGVTTLGVLKCWGNNAYYQLANGTTTSSATPTVIDSGVSYKYVNVSNIGSTAVCAITSGDILKCWGYNAKGQVGDGSNTTRTTPYTVSASLRFSTVLLSSESACAITTAATGSALYCWGGNFYGQVGNGGTGTVTTPYLLDSGVGYAMVRNGTYTNCAITLAGVLKCWGYNSHGQLGDGTTTNRSSQITVDPGTQYASVSMATTTTCAITTLGALRCFGDNANYGLVGDGTSVNRPNSVLVDAGVSYSKVVLNLSAACAITTAQTLKCWGSNALRQLGDGTIYSRNAPVTIDAGVAYADIQIISNTGNGTGSTCGVTTAGTMKCWGTNHLGQIGDGTSMARVLPFATDTGTTYSKIINGGLVICGITDGGVLKCWGRNDVGQIGNGLTSPVVVPTVIDSGTLYRDLSVSGGVTCGITIANDLKCWGTNTNGPVGNGTTTNVLVPTLIDSGTKYATVTTLGTTTCGITLTGVLKCWGLNTSGQVGNSQTTNQLTPVVVDSGTTYSFIMPGSCGITTSKVLKCWGSNANGQAGVGNTTTVSAPTIIDPGVNYKAVYSNYGTTCALTDAGALKCWGLNNNGQVGDGTSVQKTSPVAIDVGTVYSKLTLYTYSACGITNSGVLKCWGNGSSGQIGNGAGVSVSTPTAVGGGATYQDITTNYNACALTTTGLMHCWGDNTFGQVGDGTNLLRTTPQVVDSGTSFKNLGNTLGNSTCSITTAGVVKCWGRNDYGQAGDGVALFRAIPRSITKWLTP